jgi:putative membrane protein
MQLILILGIVFAIGAVTFALQNNVPVTVVFAAWHYDSSLALVLLVALGLGALIAGLVSTPSVINGPWSVARLRRRFSTASPWRP